MSLFNLSLDRSIRQVEQQLVAERVTISRSRLSRIAELGTAQYVSPISSLILTKTGQSHLIPSHPTQHSTAPPYPAPNPQRSSNPTMVSQKSHACHFPSIANHQTPYRPVVNLRRRYLMQVPSSVRLCRKSSIRRRVSSGITWRG
jgi:hypothetical protein